ncbi:MAG: hypothetical protein IKT55_03230 [Clostridia bacterium]|nr:hypothetical protein [Clostridia bacterium]
MNNCQCKINCTSLAVIISVIIGVVAAFLTLTGNLAVGTPLLWVFFGVATGFLAVTLVSTRVFRCDERENCLCPTLSVLLTGVLGTILFSLVLLFVDVAIASVIGAILVGLLFLFFSLTLTTTACLIKCLADCR